jgi:hypothetical protein
MKYHVVEWQSYEKLPDKFFNKKQGGRQLPFSLC